MKKNTRSVPVNRLMEEVPLGIFTEKINSATHESFHEASSSHRHDYHIFLWVESGELHVEIDFETYTLPPNSITYIHPSQIHRIININQASFHSLSITSDNVRAEYIKLLEQSILPSKPLHLEPDIAQLLSESSALCQKLFIRKGDRIYSTFVKDSCNSFIGLCISQFLQWTKNKESASRYETVTKAFRQLLEIKFAKMNKPGDYAEALNISTSYLRECVRATTGLSVSEHIQNRIILEAKRLLYYSDKSVKEIGIALGYEDYSYFSRLFKKIVGITALDFRMKNRNPS